MSSEKTQLLRKGRRERPGKQNSFRSYGFPPATTDVSCQNLHEGRDSCIINSLWIRKVTSVLPSPACSGCSQSSPRHQETTSSSCSMAKPSPHDWEQTGCSDCFPSGSASTPHFSRASGPSDLQQHRGDATSGDTGLSWLTSG